MPWGTYYCEKFTTQCHSFYHLFSYLKTLNLWKIFGIPFIVSLPLNERPNFNQLYFFLKLVSLDAFELAIHFLLELISAQNHLPKRILLFSRYHLYQSLFSKSFECVKKLSQLPSLQSSDVVFHLCWEILFIIRSAYIRSRSVCHTFVNRHGMSNNENIPTNGLTFSLFLTEFVN